MYKAVLRETGQEVAVKVQRPEVEPLVFRDLYLFRKVGGGPCPSASPHHPPPRANQGRKYNVDHGSLHP